jgi:hypothetical protein
MLRTKAQVLGVLAAIGNEVSAIYVVDDACPEETGVHVRASCLDTRVRVLINDTNLGVGGATMRGYRAALEDQMDILVKSMATDRWTRRASRTSCGLSCAGKPTTRRATVSSASRTSPRCRGCASSETRRSRW